MSEMLFDVWGKSNRTRLMAQEYILAGVRRGMTQYKIIKMLRENYMSYRTANMVKDIHMWKTYYERSSHMRYVNKNKIISEDLYMPTTRLHGAKFETVMKYHGYNRITGEEIEGYMTIKHLHKYGVHIGMDLIQTYTPEQLTEKIKEVLNSAYGMDADLDRSFAVMGFVNPEL